MNFVIHKCNTSKRIDRYLCNYINRYKYANKLLSLPIIPVEQVSQKCIFRSNFMINSFFVTFLEWVNCFLRQKILQIM